MRVALCISGELRNFEVSWKSIKKNVVDPLNADVYIFSWESATYNETLQQMFNFKSPHVTIPEANPVAYKIQNYKDGKWKTHKIKAAGGPMFYGIEESFNLLPHGYDILIRSRPDATFYEPFNVPDIKPNTIYVAGLTKESHVCYTGDKPWCHGLPHVPDMLACGCHESMYRYSRCYGDLRFDIHASTLMELGKPFFAEEILAHHLARQALNVEPFWTKFSFLNVNGSIARGELINHETDWF